MNPLETTEAFPSEVGAINKVRSGQQFYHSPNEYYGGKKKSNSVRNQTKAVGHSQGTQHHQMNRPVGYAYSGGHIRLKNKLFDKSPGLLQPRSSPRLQMSDEGAHPINRDSLRGVLGRTRPKSLEQYHVPKDRKSYRKKKYKSITKKVKKSVKDCKKKCEKKG